MKVVFVLVYLVSPLHLTGSLVDCVKGSGTRTDEELIARNCGSGVDSASGFEFPKLLTSRVRTCVLGLLRLLRKG